MKGNNDMKTTSHLKLTIVPWVRGSIRCPPLRRVFLFVPFLLTCFALSQTAQAVVPPPDGGYASRNTAEGKDALFSLTTGVDNTALGFQALYNGTTASGNTAAWSQALLSNTASTRNVAVCAAALDSLTSGEMNTAVRHGTFLGTFQGGD